MRTTKHMRLPNGFGQISFIKGKLRKPYRAMITVGFADNGRPICQILKPQGYFATYTEAFTALIEQQKNPYDISKDICFKDLYEEWYKIQEQSAKHGNLNHYRMGYKNLKEIYDMPVKDIKPRVIRSVIDKHRDTPSAPKRMKVVLNLVMDYALENELIPRNYARETKIETSFETINEHISFTDEELNILWQHTDDDTVKMILIQCYTGLRPGELTSLECANIILDENYLIGGMKTKAGTNRKVPIHPSIKPFLEKYLEENFGQKYLFHKSESYKVRIESYRVAFKNTLSKYQLNEAHRCHDPRKCFVTEAKKYQLDEYAIKLIVGHAIKDITEKVYTERSLDWLYAEICKIKSPCRNNVGIDQF